MSEPAIFVNSGGPLTRAQRLRSYAWFYALAVSTFGLDRLTKWLVIKNIAYNPYHEHGSGLDVVVVRDFFYFIHIGNTGAAWSMFSGKSTLLGLLAVGTLAAIYIWRETLGLKHRLAQLAFGLLCGGILGNLVDRLTYKHVIDFIDLHFGSYVYPTFNVADSGICIGVLLYLWHSWKQPN